MSEKEFAVQTGCWYASARRIAAAIPSTDFIGWHGEHYVVVRSEVQRDREASASTNAGGSVGAGTRREKVELKELPARRRLDCGTGVDLGSEDAAWLERKDVPIDYEMPGLLT